MARALNGLTGVVDPPDMIAVRGTARLHVPDWLPPSVSALRVLLAVPAISLFWIASAWPNGASAITFCAVIVVLLPLQGDVAYSASMTFLKGCVLGCRRRRRPGVRDPSESDNLPKSVPRVGTCARAARISARPSAEPALLLRGERQLPADALDQQWDQLTTHRSFGTAVSAILVGIAVGAVAMLIVPPVSPAIRTSRLLALTLADLRRLAKRAPSRRREDEWESRVVARLLAMPEQAEPVERAELVAAVAVGERDRAAAPCRASVRPGRGGGRGASSAGRRTKRRGDRAPQGHRPPTRRPAPRQVRQPYPCFASGPASCVICGQLASNTPPISTGRIR